MTITELEEALLALPRSSYEELVEKVTQERWRRVCAAAEEARRPLHLAHHQRHLEDHLPEVPWCRDFEDGLDGYTVHATTCTYWPKSFLSGSGCIKEPG